MQEKLTPEQKEYRLQLAVVKHLDTYYKGKCEWFHIPNRPGDGKDGNFKKLMGAKAGAADLVIGWRGGNAFIELKAPGGILSSAQNKFLSRWAFLGWRVAVCQSVREVNEALKRWGLDSGVAECLEPDYRSWDEKVEGALGLFAPPKS